MVLQAHSLLANLKHRNRNLKIQKRKKLVTLMVSYLNQSRFFKAGQAHCRAGGRPDYSSSSAASSSVFTPDSLPLSGGLLEVEASVI